MCTSDPWSLIVGRLCDPALCHASTRAGMTRQCVSRFEQSQIHRIEWHSRSMILVSWSDARAGRRENQMWRASVARTTGVCKLSGTAVRCGDVIFRPTRRKNGLPMGAPDMILAERLSGPASDSMVGATAGM
jgi:hypothetical protein